VVTGDVTQGAELYKMYPHEEKVLKEITNLLKKTFPDRIDSVYAFGSRVRGDFHEWSDFDVLVVVKNRTAELTKAIIGIFVDEEIKAGVSLAPVIKDISSFEQEKRYHTPFYENIMKDGVPL
jgi:uncharacterized protein